jgi:hypothetical protein
MATSGDHKYMQNLTMDQVTGSEQSSQDGDWDTRNDISGLMEQFKQNIEVYKLANQGVDSVENRERLRRQYDHDLAAIYATNGRNAEGWEATRWTAKRCSEL